MMVVPSVCLGKAVIVESHDGLPDPIRLALDLTGLTVITLDDGDALLAQLPAIRPDIIIRNVAGCSDRWRLIAEHHPCVVVTDGPSCVNNAIPATKEVCLDRDSTCDVAYLALRSLIRRERPGLLFQTRRSGVLSLNEETYQLFRNDRSAHLTKTDLCILGPFFDVHDAILDRATMTRLAYGNRYQKYDSKLLFINISRARRIIKQQLGHDPLRTVRHIGCTLNDS